MEIKSTLTRKAFTRLKVGLALRDPWVYVFVALTVIFLVLALRNKSLFDLILALVFIALAGYYLANLLYKLYSRKSRHFFTNWHFILGDEGILVRISGVEWEQLINWEGIKEWDFVNGSYILRLFNGKIVTFIQKSDIPNEDIKNFERILNNKIYKILISDPARK